MDKLDVLRNARKLGGETRRDRMNEVAVFARRHDCDISATAGNSGTFQIRYGSLNLPLLDMSADGTVTIYMRPRYNGVGRKELSDRMRQLIEEDDQLKVDISSRKYSSKLDDKLEEIPEGRLVAFLEATVTAIQESIYTN